MPHTTKIIHPNTNGQTDWKRLAKMTDAEIACGARTDPDNPPLTDSQLRRTRRVVPRGNGFYGPPPKR